MKVRYLIMIIKPCIFWLINPFGYSHDKQPDCYDLPEDAFHRISAGSIHNPIISWQLTRDVTSFGRIESDPDWTPLSGGPIIWKNLSVCE